MVTARLQIAALQMAAARRTRAAELRLGAPVRPTAPGAPAWNFGPSIGALPIVNECEGKGKLSLLYLPCFLGASLMTLLTSHTLSPTCPQCASITPIVPTYLLPSRLLTPS